MRRHHLGFGLLIAVLLSTSGCSFLFVKGPPDVPEDDYGSLSYFTCTEENTWPILDAIWAGLNGLGAIAAMGSTEEELGQDPQQTMVVGFAWLGVSGVASYTGFQKTADCRRAKAIWMEDGRRGGGSAVLDLRSELLPVRGPVLRVP